MVSWTCNACLKSLPQRYVLAVMCFTAVVSLYLMRVCLAISMTQMVKPIVANVSAMKGGDQLTCPMAADAGKHWTNGTEVSVENVTQLPPPSGMQEYDWSQEEQGYILSAFYIGYVIAHMPGGLLAGRIGGKPVILLSLLASSLLSIATPTAVLYGGAHALFAIRTMLGVVQAGIFPSIATLLAAWIPKRERARVGSFVYCSGPFGAIVGNSATGFLIHIYDSWHVSFYVFGVIGIVVAAIYMALCASDPNAHPFISDAEKEYLHREMGQLERDKSLTKVPWRAMCTSKPVIAVTVAIVVGDWAYYSILIDLPKYMNDVLHVSIQDNGVLTSLPWAMFMIASVSSGFLSDWLIAHGHLGITNTRKLLTTISCLIGGVFIIGAAYAGCDITLVGTFFTIAVGAQGMQSASIFLNPLDLCPNYVGMLSGIIGTFACCMGVVVPVVISHLTPNNLLSEWRTVFWITMVVSVVQLLIFDVWGTAKVQPWNDPPTTDTIEMPMKTKAASAVATIDEKSRTQNETRRS